jgi:hypothetical protein
MANIFGFVLLNGSLTGGAMILALLLSAVPQADAGAAMVHVD